MPSPKGCPNSHHSPWVPKFTSLLCSHWCPPRRTCAHPRPPPSGPRSPRLQASAPTVSSFFSSQASHVQGQVVISQNLCSLSLNHSRFSRILLLNCSFSADFPLRHSSTFFPSTYKCFSLLLKKTISLSTFPLPESEAAVELWGAAPTFPQCPAGWLPETCSRSPVTRGACAAHRLSV